MNSGYYPAVVNKIPRVQTLSSTMQAPFYFGGSQVPVNLNMSGGSMFKTQQYKPKFNFNKKQPEIIVGGNIIKTAVYKPKIEFNKKQPQIIS